jgi:hypothetical protein
MSSTPRSKPIKAETTESTLLSRQLTRRTTVSSGHALTTVLGWLVRKAPIKVNLLPFDLFARDQRLSRSNRLLQ